MPQHLKNSLILLLGAVLLPVVAKAADVQVAGDVGVGNSDNIQRSPTNMRSETFYSAGVQFSVLEESRKLTADVAGNLAYLDYAQNTYDSELIGNVRAAATAHVIQDRFDWVFDDSFGQTRRDLTAVLTPANRENINYFSTGPNVALNLLSSATRLHIAARYSLVDYQTSPFDSVRYSGRLGIEHSLSSVSKASINLDDERIEPEVRSGVASYDRQEAYGRYDLAGARTSLALDAGISRLDQSSRADSGLLLRLKVSRKVGSLSTLSVEGGREFTDAGGSFASGTGNAPVNGLNSTTLNQTANPFASTYARFGWDITGRRTSLRFSTDWAEESYQGQPLLDRKRYAASATFSRQLSAQLDGRLGYTYAHNGFATISSDYHEATGIAGLTWRAGRRISVDLEGEIYGYSSQNLTGSINETRVWLRLRYGDATVRQVGDSTLR